MPRLEGKTALITGASRGIGQAIADRFLAEGATVIISDINHEQGQALVETLGESAHYLPLDVSQDTSAIHRQNHPCPASRDPAARALARNLTAEMHSGFMALREDCPNNLNNTWEGFNPSEAVLADIARIEELWALARERHGTDGPWLFGAYSLADVFYAPVACRITTSGLPVSAAAQAYVDLQLVDPALRRWRAMGQTRSYTPFPYMHGDQMAAWPGQRLSAKPVDHGTPENNVCPYSGKEITHLLDVEGRIFGFCNAFCRDKTMYDPAAWPKFMALFSRG